MIGGWFLLYLLLYALQLEAVHGRFKIHFVPLSNFSCRQFWTPVSAVALFNYKRVHVVTEIFRLSSFITVFVEYTHRSEPRFTLRYTSRKNKLFYLHSQHCSNGVIRIHCETQHHQQPAQSTYQFLFIFLSRILPSLSLRRPYDICT